MRGCYHSTWFPLAEGTGLQMLSRLPKCTPRAKTRHMTTPLETLIGAGTKLWLDSVDPDLVRENRDLGATGATSNPIIISDLIRTGRFDQALSELMDRGLDDEDVAWQLTDRLVSEAEAVFADVHADTVGNDGYVSFELDPLLEDADCPLSINERRDRYVELGTRWAEGHSNRMIKVPATEAGISALEDLTAVGVTLNVTLLFTDRQYTAARDAIWRGAQRRQAMDAFKSVYSIFISRIDVYTKQHVPDLSDDARGQVGIVSAKRMWQLNRSFWQDRNLRLDQEIVFASTGAKDPADAADKYVSALAGSDIQTNPPGTNVAIQAASETTYSRTVDELPPQSMLDEIDAKVDFERMEAVLMSEGIAKFARPQKELLALISEKRRSLTAAG